MAAAADDLKIAVIGGSGLYSMEGLTAIREVYPKTPWGYPSDKMVISKTERGQQVAFLARHGQGHVFNPSEIPVRANIAALKSLGVQVIIAYSAVGSLREEIRPRDFVLPDQIIDRTKGIRPSTFFEGGLASHAVFADPFCKPLANLISAQASALGGQVTLHQGKTLVCMEGPAFSTRAESHLYRAWGGDVINMSALPEAKLAREAEIAYQMVCMATDYDCWKEEEEPVSVETVVNTMAANAANASNLLLAVIESVQCALDITGDRHGSLAGLYTGSMRNACMTSREKRSQEALEKIEFLLPGTSTEKTSANELR